MPPEPGLEAEMLSRLMMRFGTPERRRPRRSPRPRTGARAASPTTARASRRASDGVAKLVVDDPFDRAWRRVGLALDRVGFTVVDRDRSKGIYFVRYADPDADMTRKDREKGFLAKLVFWKTDEKDKPEQYRIKVVEAGADAAS